jgi:sucrose phosphorylase
VERTGRYRSINRHKFLRSELEGALADPESLRSRVFDAYRHLIRARIAHRAFHPNAPQRVLTLHPALFVLLRTAPDGSETCLCLHNVTAKVQTLVVDMSTLELCHRGEMRDIISGTAYTVEGDALLDHAFLMPSEHGSVTRGWIPLIRFATLFDNAGVL